MPEMLDEMQEGTISESIQLIVSPTPAARETYLYVQETGYLEHSSQSFASENLDSYLLMYVVKGHGKLIYETSEYQLNEEDIFFINCKKYHKYYGIRNGWTVLYLYINGLQVHGYYNTITNNKTPIFTVKNSKTTASLFWQIITLHRKKSRYAEVLSSLHITRILTDISMFGNDEAILDAEFPLYIDYVFHYINHNYNKKITLDMLSELYCVNKFHLAREFKRCSGTTINEYVITTRINKAKELLHYTTKSVEEIADEVGFYSSSHFIKLFRSREYVTPLFYRKQWTR